MELTRPLKVAKKIQETPDTVSFVLEIPQDKRSEFNYQPGQFVTLFLNINGQEIRRSYSLASSPLVDTEFKISVKRVADGVGSNFLLDHIEEGSTLNVTPPAGRFFKLPPDSNPRHFILFAAGSGITPIISILKSVLEMNPDNKVTLVYSSRNRESIIFYDELVRLEQSHSDRLTVLHVLSQPGGKHSGYTGRVTDETITEILGKCSAGSLRAEYYLCGPTGFMEAVERALDQRTVDRETIHKESFFSAPSASQPTVSYDEDEGADRVYIGDKSLPRERDQYQLEVVLDGETHVLSHDGEASILEALLDEGINAPYSCMEGNCMACMGKVKEGLVFQDDPGILTDDNIENNETLTCQARPASKKVKIDYDEL